MTRLREISNYWEEVRKEYAAFDRHAAPSRVYLHRCRCQFNTTSRRKPRQWGLDDRASCQT